MTGPCTYPDCGKGSLAKGLCVGHYQQKYHTGKMRPLRVKGAAVARRARTKKLCSFPGCGRSHYANHLCRAHCAQVYAGRELSPLQGYNPAPRRAEAVALMVEGKTNADIMAALGLTYEQTRSIRRAEYRKGTVEPSRDRAPSKPDGPRWLELDNLKQECARCPLRGHKTEDCDLPMRQIERAGMRVAA